MTITHKPLFRPEVLREKLRAFALPDGLDAAREKLARQAANLRRGHARGKESTLFPGFFADVFGELLGYVQPAQADAFRPPAGANAPGPALALHTFHPNFATATRGLADAAIGRGPLEGDPSTVIAVVEMKGPADPLDIPYGGRRLSAVEQGFGYAIDLGCDWIMVSSMVETRLYCKRADRLSCERFLIERLADPADTSQLRKFVYLLGAARVVPPAPARCHLDELFDASREAGRAVTNRFYAEYADMRLRAFGHLRQANPGADPLALLTATQKTLDRVLFCAFSEDRGLLPSKSIMRAFDYVDPYAIERRPRWDNFRGLFRFIDQGNPAQGIARYNGGLFAHDPFLDGALAVPDEVCGVFKRLAEYEYGACDPADESFPDNPAPPAFLDVEILGHIFEQSITDLEKLRGALAAGTELPAAAPPAAPAKTTTRRKKEGAFYTPVYVTRFLVKNALGGVLADRFEALRASHAAAAKGKAAEALGEPRAYAPDALAPKTREALLAFWSAWRDELGRVRVLDPACGSGAFLIEVFDQLLAEYQEANGHFDTLSSQPEFLDLNRLILQQNLFGVDLNAEAVEICRLSLWIKTAEKGKVLADLDRTIVVGNSLVDDPAFAPGKAFDWGAAFPEVFADGGFDVVVGNPPYVRQEWIAPIKPHLQAKYAVYSGTADLYLYFVERGLGLLKDGGRLGFITSGTFTRGSFAAEFRRWLPTVARFETLVNFGENQPFDEAEMVYPTMYVLRKLTGPAPFPTLFLNGGIPPDIQKLMDAESLDCDNTDIFGQREWKFQPASVTALAAKLMNQGTPLREACGGRMYYGIKTGLNEAFFIDQATRDRLVKQDKRSKDLLKKVLTGQDLRPWHQEYARQWLIFAKRGTDLSDYPAVLAHLETYREQLEPRPDNWSGKPDEWPGRKPGNYRWYELQDSIDYHTEFDQPKILWPDIAKLPRFSFDKDGYYLGNTGYIMVPPSPHVLPVLQSRALWFCISQLAMPLRLRGGLWQYRCIDTPLAQVPIPDTKPADRRALGDLGALCTAVAKERATLHASARHRIATDLLPRGTAPNTALTAWWNLDFRGLRAELAKAGKTDIAVRERDDWDAQLAGWKAGHDALTSRLIDAETEINERVYGLFGMGRTEIEMLEDFQRRTRTFYPLGET